MLVKIAVLLLLTVSAFGQRIDSLEKILASPMAKKQRVDVLNELSRELNYVNRDKSDKLSLEALYLAREIQYKQGYYLKQNNHKAVEYYLNKLDSTTKAEASQKSKIWESLTKNAINMNKLENDNAYLKIQYALEQKLATYGIVAFVLLTLLLLSMIILLSLLLRKNKALKETNSTLANQTTLIEKQRQDLEVLNETKNKFFAIIAHDFKSPLISLRDYSKVLAKQIDTLSKEELVKVTVELHKVFEKTVKLSENLIMWAQLQMHGFKSRPKEILLIETLTEVNQFLENYALQKQIKIHVRLSDTLTVFADIDHVSLILRNLINNALKFSHRGGIIEISAKDIDTTKVEITIADAGLGMKKEMQEHVWNLHKKITMHGTENEIGTGLGLILCSEFIKLNNGTLQFQSVEGKGTTFIIQLPKTKK